jgi:hypothetical protein
MSKSEIATVEENPTPDFASKIAMLDNLATNIGQTLATIESLVGTGTDAKSGLDNAVIEAQTLHQQISDQATTAKTLNTTASALFTAAQGLVNEAKNAAAQAIGAAERIAGAQESKRSRGYGLSNSSQIEE